MVRGLINYFKSPYCPFLAANTLAAATPQGDGSITSDTTRLVQPEQQTTWQTGPVPLGV